MNGWMDGWMDAWYLGRYPENSQNYFFNSLITVVTGASSYHIACTLQFAGTDTPNGPGLASTCMRPNN